MKDTTHPIKTDERLILKQYFKEYLIAVRKLSLSSVQHYFNALNTASRYLREKQLVAEDIYEIRNLTQLHAVRDILYVDPEFMELDTRGRRMYSAGLNNYCRFAEGEDFRADKSHILQLDMPIDVPVHTAKNTKRERFEWRRSDILREQVMQSVNYTCEVNSTHQSFLARKNNKPYMEGHHIIPLRYQQKFDYSLDVYANIICLCPVCHRLLHYGIKRDIEPVLEDIWEKRKERFAKSGLVLTESKFMDLVL